MDSKDGKEISPNSSSVRDERKNEAKESFCHIDKEMVRFKIHFFMFFGALGTMLPYVPLIAKDRIGISATSLGTVLTVLLFSTIFTKTALGYVADYFKRIKLMMSVLIIMHCLFFLSLLFIPPLKRNALNSTSTDYFKDYEKDTELTIVSMSRNLSCDVSNDLVIDFKDVNSSLEESTNSLESNLDVVCFRLNNASQMICFQSGNDTRNNHMSLKTQMGFCCSTYTSTFAKLKMAEKHLYFASFELGTHYKSYNETSQCSVEFTDRLTEFTTPEPVNDFETYQFWLYATFMILAGNFISSAFTLSDTICCESVQKYKRDFGRQRIFSAFSWGMLAPLGGLLFDLTNDFYATWVLMVSLQCLTLWNLYKMDIVIPQFSQNLAKDVGTVLKSPTFLAFNAGVFINGIWSGIIWYYLLWFISSLGASAFLCGMIPYVQCFAGELPFMFFSGRIIDKIGHFNSLTLSLLSYGVRFLWYSYLENPWFALPVEIVHGITYGLYYPTVASFGKLSAKTATEATTQSILFSTHEGLGSGVGCVLAGIGFDTFGGHWTFFYFSLFAFGSALFNICSTLLVGRRFSPANHASHPSNG